VSAEHGVGLLKKDYLTYSRSETEIALMRQVKQIFDPKGLMNPGKIFD
jgi:FAD/FMN-containing dehydrogenase